MILEQIKGPQDIRQMSLEELGQLAQEIRAFLIEKISHTGGPSGLKPWRGRAYHCDVPDL